MISATMRICTMTFLLAVSSSAETLYDREGIQLQGTARVVTYEASTCRVLEERHSETEYEDIEVEPRAPTARLATGLLCLQRDWESTFILKGRLRN